MAHSVYLTLLEQANNQSKVISMISVSEWVSEWAVFYVPTNTV